MAHFGEWVRDTRTKQGRSQGECAASVGMKVQYWNHLEKHVKRPEAATVKLIAQALRVEEDVALLEAGHAPAVPIGPDAELSMLFLGLTKEQQALLLDAAKAFRQALEGRAA